MKAVRPFVIALTLTSAFACGRSPTELRQPAASGPPLSSRMSLQAALTGMPSCSPPTRQPARGSVGVTACVQGKPRVPAPESQRASNYAVAW
jgi:hypothetical protein